MTWTAYLGCAPGLCLGYRCHSGYSETFKPALPKAMTASAQTADPQASLAPLGPAFPPDFPPVWASAWGEDAYGWYADFVVGEVWQRCRWIPPGRFWMGSPEDEKDRVTDGLVAETQHHVTLTQGFWLADTACTQALWQAVMGTNPAHFQGEGAGSDQPAEHPVEKVSWDAIAASLYGSKAREESCFLNRLNRLVPGLDAGLPTEAQWEWACRADARNQRDTLPFAFGKTITVQQANYNGNYPYGDAPKGEYRERTVPVKAFKPNAWGLYQMHGNVREWCRDWLVPYPAQPQQDPEGPPSGERRVLRGGSWNYGARDLRSAYRLGDTPDYRGGIIGFRLAPGQSSTGSRAAEPPGGLELGRGTRTGR